MPHSVGEKIVMTRLSFLSAKALTKRRSDAVVCPV